MSTDWTVPTARDASGDKGLSAVLAMYLAALDHGEQPDHEALLQRYPHLADQMRAFFAGAQCLDHLAAPLRLPAAEPLPPADADAVPFDLLEEIGRGGMGVVLRGRDPVLGRDLAVKVLLDHFCADPDLVRRFVEEARITGGLQHPFIVPVHKLGALPDGRPYFAMKLIQGRTLAELLAERTDPTHDRHRFLKVFEQVCQTLAYAHSKGVIHRDLKPANVMVGAFAEVQVMDWGLAKVLGESQDEGDSHSRQAPSSNDQTQAGSVLGTLAYMPPEQACGNVARVDRRSDVFGLGAILCEILTGHPPYTGTSAEVQEKARRGEVVEAVQRLQDCGADRELIDLARGCLAADRQARPAEAAAVADAVASYFAAAQERLRATEIARAKAETEAVEERKRVALAEARAAAEEKRAWAERKRRRATLVMAGSLLLLVAGAATFGLWYQGQQAEQAAEAAVRRAATARDVTAALGEARLLHQEGLRQAEEPWRWRLTLTAARSALKRAEEAVERGEPTEALLEELAVVRAVLDRDERDCGLFDELDRLRLDAINVSDGMRRVSRSAAHYASAFRAYGLDLNTLDPAETAARIKAHPHRDRLLDEIDRWAMLLAETGRSRRPSSAGSRRGINLGVPDWSKAERLLRVLDAVDPGSDAFRRRWRAARVKDDGTRLAELSRSAEAAKATSLGVVNLATDLLRARAYDAAQELLRRRQQQIPQDFWINMNLGQALVATKPSAPDEALRFFTAALAVRGPNLHGYLILCEALARLGKTAEALGLATAAVKLDGSSAQAHTALGNVLLSQRDFDGAIRELRRACELDPESAIPRFNLGTLYLDREQYAEASRYLREALARDPSWTKAHVNLGNAHARQHDLDGAVKEYRAALAVDPDDVLAHYCLGKVLDLKKDHTAAIRCYEDAIAADPDYLAAYFSLADTLVELREIDGAVKAGQRGVARNPNSADAWLQLGRLLLALGRYGAAEDALRRTIALNPKSAPALGNLGILLGARQDWDGAIRCYRSALEVNALDPKLHDFLGSALYHKNDLEGAIRCHRKAIQLDPMLASAYQNLGLVQRAQGDVEAAAGSFRDAIRLNSGASKPYQLLGEVLLVLREVDKAIEQLQVAIKREPKNAEAYIPLALAQMDRGEYDTALATLQRGQGQLPALDPHGGLYRQLIAGTERFVALEQKLPAVLRGEVQPANPQEQLILGQICARGKKRQHAAAAARFFAAAFQAQPALADNLQQHDRYDAACSAVFAGTGRSTDGAALSAAEQTRLRRQGRAWLQADLDALAKGLTGGSPQGRVFVRNVLRHWLRDPELACVRDPAELLGLPTEEREDWLTLWDDAAALRTKASAPRSE